MGGIYEGVRDIEGDYREWRGLEKFMIEGREIELEERQKRG